MELSWLVLGPCGRILDTSSGDLGSLLASWADLELVLASLSSRWRLLDAFWSSPGSFLISFTRLWAPPGPRLASVGRVLGPAWSLRGSLVTISPL